MNEAEVAARFLRTEFTVAKLTLLLSATSCRNCICTWSADAPLIRVGRRRFGAIL